MYVYSISFKYFQFTSSQVMPQKPSSQNPSRWGKVKICAPDNFLHRKRSPLKHTLPSVMYLQFILRNFSVSASSSSEVDDTTLAGREGPWPGPGVLCRRWTLSESCRDEVWVRNSSISGIPHHITLNAAQPWAYDTSSNTYTHTPTHTYTHTHTHTHTHTDTHTHTHTHTHSHHNKEAWK